ncbi:MAG: DUF2164 domain-containing protein [Rhizobiales bacterium]|nr:DUF2164 domain-containing protein [Hyphomicrobiales bacterium]NRB13421.1 DUF2164 domain-containing protein [Hyphomicrobiales bacterium]
MIDLSTDRKAELIHKIKLYFEAELDQDIGQFDAEFLLEFFAKELGSNIYNQALWDMQAQLKERFELMNDIIYQLEK